MTKINNMVKKTAQQGACWFAHWSLWPQHLALVLTQTPGLHFKKKASSQVRMLFDSKEAFHDREEAHLDSKEGPS